MLDWVITMDERYWIWLAEGLGAEDRYVKPVLEYFGSARKVYELANRETLQEMSEIGRKQARALCNKSLKQAEKIIKQCEERQIGILTYEDYRYPKQLKEIYSPPLVLYYKGTIPDFSKNILFTIVGTRKSTKEGNKTAYEFAAQMSQHGITVVSGMAEGIDSYANKGASEGPTPTIAVLGCGVDVVYPANNGALMEKIIRTGLVISEYPPGSSPLKHHFPIRNRIMAGLSEGTLIVEAPKTSGALITANRAIEENKEVFAVPGSIYSHNHVGSNRLLFDGAHPVMSPADIYEVFHWEIVETPEEEKKGLDLDGLPPAERKIAEVLQYHGQLFIDDLTEYVNFPGPQVLSSLMMMEIKGLVMNLGGDVYRLLS